jgi:putative endonuclease
MSLWHTYIILCRDHTYYTGISNDLPKRMATHNSGKGAAYTRGRGPVQLIYSEQFNSKSAALKREIAIKKLTRQAKEQLIAKHG